eukprot:TRINITY_DN16516_c0_g1_i1.p1 TRINITY_DN16516_c0_g1~~TRINITY_DN16516_c0_g1_i1.p1  ORF type:complete len:217 (+),score=42.39 TRINITY_DN16516_c0_g1_i1:71-721(+)
MAASRSLCLQPLVWLASLLLLVASPCAAIRFTLDRTECFFEEVKYDGDQVTGSFVITDTDVERWDWTNIGVDLTVEAPAGHVVYSAKKQSEEKFTFIAGRKGMYKFCFANQSPIHETVVFEVHVGHIPTSSQVAKDEHFDPIEAAIYRVQEAVWQVQFEQHWINSNAERHENVDKSLNRRVMYKAALEAVAMIGASLLQVYLLRRLFEKKFSKVRV